jgi:ribonucleases P/MRP protein subunit RPP40
VKAVHVVSLDINKAFDQVCHDKLIQETIDADFPVTTSTFLLNYLKGRTQAVKYSGMQSDVAKVTSGVPQGSVLGPFLFNFFIRDLKHSNDKCITIKYADDTTILVPSYRCCANNDICSLEIQHVRNWCQKMGLKLNESKTKVMTINSNYRKTVEPDENVSSSASPVTNIKLLGVYFTQNFGWELQFEYLSKVLSSRLYALRILKKILSKSELLQIYKCLMGSLIDYACPLFLNATLANDEVLKRITKRAHKIICGPLCMEKCIPDITSRRLELSMIFFKKIIGNTDHVLRPYLPPQSNRSNRLIIPFCSKQKYINSFPIKCAIQYNSL